MGYVQFLGCDRLSALLGHDGNLSHPSIGLRLVRIHDTARSFGHSSKTKTLNKSLNILGPTEEGLVSVA
jgi:hypothetical protein